MTKIAASSSPRIRNNKPTTQTPNTFSNALPPAKRPRPGQFDRNASRKSNTTATLSRFTVRRCFVGMVFVYKFCLQFWCLQNAKGFVLKKNQWSLSTCHSYNVRGEYWERDIFWAFSYKFIVSTLNYFRWFTNFRV